jgi:hypothetical protein
MTLSLHRHMDSAEYELGYERHIEVQLRIQNPRACVKGPKPGERIELDCTEASAFGVGPAPH